MHNQLTQEYVRSAFKYDPDTGILLWRKRPEEHFKTIQAHRRWNTIFSGTVAGSLWSNTTGQYYCVKIDRKTYSCHRIIWLYIHDENPEYIDHIDGNGLNNKLSNLRSTTRQENNKNRKLSKANKSGVSGVRWVKSRSKWEARINNNTKELFLGLFSDFFEAVCVRKSAERRFGYHENHCNR